MIYNFIEVIFRGYTHWSMSLAGGSVLMIFYLLNGSLRAIHPIFSGMIGSVVITCIELITGVIFNIVLGMNVWDYSHMPLNFLGQICPMFSLLWMPLTLAAEWVYRQADRKLSALLPLSAPQKMEE